MAKHHLLQLLLLASYAASRVQARLMAIINDDPSTIVDVHSHPNEWLYLEPDGRSSGGAVVEYQATTPIKDQGEKKYEEVPFLYDENYPNPRMVVFYAHWCPHCKHFKPKYVDFADSMNRMMAELANNHRNRTQGQADDTMEEDYPVESFKFESFAVSCVPYKALCHNQSVHGFPMINLYKAHSAKGVKIDQGQVHPMQILRILGMSINGENLSDEPVRTIPKVANGKSIGDTTLRGGLPAVTGVGTIPSVAETYHDAFASLVFNLRTATFAAVPTGKPLEGDKKKALKNFLKLLRNSSPPTVLWEDLLKDLDNSFDDSIANETAWIKAIDKRAPAKVEWTPFCKIGYTCGLWQLFHIVSVGVVECNKIVPSTEMAPGDVADQIRDFIAEFFLCDECKNNFVRDYDACKYDRCNLLQTRKNKHITLEDWKMVPFWLSQTHNGVTARLKRDDPTVSLQQALWPPKVQCPTCWSGTGQEGAENVSGKKGAKFRVDADGNEEAMPEWNEEHVYDYLRMSYWPNDAKTLEMRRQLTIETAKHTIPTRPMAPLIGVAAIVCGVLVWYRHRKIQYVQQGMHKDA